MSWLRSSGSYPGSRCPRRRRPHVVSESSAGADPGFHHRSPLLVPNHGSGIILPRHKRRHADGVRSLQGSSRSQNRTSPVERCCLKIVRPRASDRNQWHHQRGERCQRSPLRRRNIFFRRSRACISHRDRPAPIKSQLPLSQCRLWHALGRRFRCKFKCFELHRNRLRNRNDRLKRRPALPPSQSSNSG